MKQDLRKRRFAVRREFIERALKVLGSCAVTHVVARGLLPKLFPSLNRLSPSDLSYHIPNKVVSSLHGAAVSLLAIDIIFHRRSFEKDVFRPYPKQLDVLFSTTLGYALYDMVVMAIHREDGAVMWMHHILEALGCFFMMCFRQAPFFPAAFSITEMSVIPQNLLWVMQRARPDWKGSKAEGNLLLVRLLTVLVFRTFVWPWAIKYALDKGDFVKNVRQTHWFVITASLINMVRSTVVAALAYIRRDRPRWARLTFGGRSS